MVSAGAGLGNDRRAIYHLVFLSLSLIPLWIVDFPSGIDLPQHAYLFRVLSELLSGPSERDFFYYFNPFTPYLTTYVVGAYLSDLLNTVVACKIILSLIVITTPLALDYWLSSFEGDRRLAVLGYPLVFDFHYHWGFVSFGVAIPLLLLVLGIFNSNSPRPLITRGALLSILLLLLLSTHLYAFLFAILTIGIQTLCKPRKLLHAICALPSFALYLTWKQASNVNAHELSLLSLMPVDLPNRFKVLFGGYFTADPDYHWALLGLAISIFFLLISRAGPRFKLEAFIPFSIALVFTLVLPDLIAGTSFVATRNVALVHLFFLGNIKLPHRGLRQLTPPALAAALSLLFSFRLIGFNSELIGLRHLSTFLSPTSSLASRTLETHPDSYWLGAGQFRHVGAWLTSLAGGMSDNDYAWYFQLPVQRRRTIPWMKSVSDTVHWGKENSPSLASLQTVGKAISTEQSSQWLLRQYSPPVLHNGITIYRWGQGWGDLQIDRSVANTPLSVGGRIFNHGIGVHTNGWVLAKTPEKHCTISLTCGIDDRSGGHSEAECHVFAAATGSLLWASHPISTGSQPAETIIHFSPDTLIFLMHRSRAGDSINYGHIDWGLSECLP